MHAKLKSVRSRVSKKCGQASGLFAPVGLSVKLRDAELGVQQARKNLDDVRARRLQIEAQLRELEDERGEREAQLEVERDALAGELRTAYVNGREEQLKLLLNQQDPAQVGRMLTYYGYFGRARAERGSLGEFHVDLVTGEPPTGQINGSPRLIEELNELQIVRVLPSGPVGVDRAVVHLGDNHVARSNGRVLGAQRGLAHGEELAVHIGPATQ